MTTAGEGRPEIEAVQLQPETPEAGRPGRKNVLDLMFHYRYALHVVVYVLAFWAPWKMVLGPDSGISTWLLAAGWMTRAGIMNFTAATVTLLWLGIVCTLLGASLRTWGTAYLGVGVVHRGAVDCPAVLTIGALAPPAVEHAQVETAIHC